jgi:hypothetical protein
MNSVWKFFKTKQLCKFIHLLLMEANLILFLIKNLVIKWIKITDKLEKKIELEILFI